MWRLLSTIVALTVAVFTALLIPRFSHAKIEMVQTQQKIEDCNFGDFWDSIWMPQVVISRDGNAELRPGGDTLIRYECLWDPVKIKRAEYDVYYGAADIHGTSGVRRRHEVKYEFTIFQSFDPLYFDFVDLENNKREIFAGPSVRTILIFPPGAGEVEGLLFFAEKGTPVAMTGNARLFFDDFSYKGESAILRKDFTGRVVLHIYPTEITIGGKTYRKIRFRHWGK